MKNLKNLGSVLTKTEQKNINGGICKCRIKVPGQGRTKAYENSRCCGYSGCPPC